MRDLKNEELAAVAGGRGINIGDIGSGNTTGNGNSADAGGNSVSANGNGSGNSASASADTSATATNHVMSEATTLVDELVGGIL